MVHTYVHPEKRCKKHYYTKGAKKGTQKEKGKKRKHDARKGNKENDKLNQIIMHALRAQAESRVDEVAVCRFYQHYDVPRCCANIRTTRQDQTESKTARKRWGNTEHKR